MSKGSYIYENGHLNKVNMCYCPVQRNSSTVFALINPVKVNKRPYVNWNDLITVFYVDDGTK